MKPVIQRCERSPTASIACDYWALHIIDEIDTGVSRFEDLSMALPIARNILANRLAKLRELGMIQRERCSRDARCYFYALTEAGAEFLPVIEALRAWEHWDGNPRGKPVNDLA